MSFQKKSHAHFTLKQPGYALRYLKAQQVYKKIQLLIVGPHRNHLNSISIKGNKKKLYSEVYFKKKQLNVLRVQIGLL